MSRYYATMTSPIGELYIFVNDHQVTDITFGKEKELLEEAIYEPSHSIIQEAICQLDLYFQGKLVQFQLPIHFEGTPFQQKVWEALQAIPYGETRSYKDIAKMIGNEKAVRAVGQANRKNRLPIIVPCHRVIGKNGALTGYAGKEVEKKRILLQLEGALK
ncbi:methylated-DNA--[protein]-cysteine S-methyltransferase [Aeribacillus pallidus]|uniref:methylated-DNA--[protein]-cysteine S-methyltransferase n=1 Tax=Aeribacillus pallidus TaxID=33936 RepID=UPI003D1EACD1